MSSSPLLCYTLSGCQHRHLPGDTPNPDYLSEVYVCAGTVREMSNLIKRHLPTEIVSVVEITQARREWPSNMKWVSPSPGVWGSRFPNGATVFQFVEGKKIEID